ncbi:MAG: hypothetical protein AB9834_20725 [Lentimicrobium sp.]
MMERWNGGCTGISETFNTAESLDQAESLKHPNPGRSPGFHRTTNRTAPRRGETTRPSIPSLRKIRKSGSS